MRKVEMIHAVQRGVHEVFGCLLLRLALPDRPLHLFDTFSGLPEPEAVDGDLQAGEFCCGLDDVKRYLGSEANTYFHVGRLPRAAQQRKIASLPFSTWTWTCMRGLSPS